MNEPTHASRATGLLRPVPVWASAAALVALAVALAGAVAPFHRCTNRAKANESAAIATLKNLCSAQEQLRQACAIDVDGDGVGEYGFLAELAGAVRLRRAAMAAGEGAQLDPPLVSRGFAKVQHGWVQRSGYRFACWLRGQQEGQQGDSNDSNSPNGGWCGEAAGGGAGAQRIDADRAEREWLVYAWPVNCGTSGTRTFMVDHTQQVWGTLPSDVQFGGDHAPEPGRAGFGRAEAGEQQDGEQQDGEQRDVDGVEWRLVQ